MNINIRYHFAAALMASVACLSCSSTQLSHIWRDESYTAGALTKILVVAVRKDQLRRRTWENGFTQALSARGIEATPSYLLIASTLPDTGLINTVAKQGMFDGIMLVGRSSSKITEGVTASTDIASLDSPAQTWGGWYSEFYYHEFYPGYPVIHEVVKDEVKVWATKGGERMIWSGVGEVHESGEDEDVSGEIISLIVRELGKQGVIAAGI